MEILRIDDLTKDFGGLRALQGVNLKIEKGQIKALIGPNGAGKTTLFNIVNGFLPSTQGSVFFEGEEITDLKPYVVSRKGIGRTFQTPQIFLDMSLLENIMLGFYLDTQSEFIASGLKTPGAMREEKRIGEKSLAILDFLKMANEPFVLARNLPFAHMRLLEIGRALATHPKLLLLDEPSAGLNTSESEQLGKVFKKMRDSGITIFFIEHDMDLVMNVSDEIVVLNYGEKIAENTPSQIRTDEKVIASYLGYGN